MDFLKTITSERISYLFAKGYENRKIDLNLSKKEINNCINKNKKDG